MLAAHRQDDVYDVVDGVFQPVIIVYKNHESIEDEMLATTISLNRFLTNCSR